MKLKLRAEPRDWLIFIIFAIFLLFFIAIAVGNIMALVSGNELTGINPFPAFSKDLFPLKQQNY